MAREKTYDYYEDMSPYLSLAIIVVIRTCPHTIFSLDPNTPRDKRQGFYEDLFPYYILSWPPHPSRDKSHSFYEDLSPSYILSLPEHPSRDKRHGFWPGALTPGHSSNTICFGVGSLPIAVSTKQRTENCARKIVHHGFNKTAFKRLGSPP